MTAQDKSYRRGPGYVITEAIRQKMRESSRKRWQDQAQRAKVSKQQTIIIPIEEIVKLYQSGMTLREIAPHFGVNYDTIWRRLKDAGVKSRRTGTRDQWADKHFNWSSYFAGYQACHTRLNRRFGKPKRCEICGTTDPTKIYDWANLTGRYHDMNDFKRMCRKCHMNYDWDRRGRKRTW